MHGVHSLTVPYNGEPSATKNSVSGKAFARCMCIHSLFGKGSRKYVVHYRRGSLCTIPTNPTLTRTLALIPMLDALIFMGDPGGRIVRSFRITIA